MRDLREETTQSRKSSNKYQNSSLPTDFFPSNVISEKKSSIWLCLCPIDGPNLRIVGVHEKDDGEYTCEVETKDRNNPKSITHKLLVLQRPTISTSYSHHNLSVIKGSSVVLDCAASGNPPPIILWTKQHTDLAGLDHSLRDNNTNYNCNLLACIVRNSMVNFRIHQNQILPSEPHWNSILSCGKPSGAKIESKVRCRDQPLFECKTQISSKFDSLNSIS